MKKIIIILFLVVLAVDSPARATGCERLGKGARAVQVARKVGDVGLTALQYCSVHLPRYYASYIPVYKNTFLNLKIVRKLRKSLFGQATWERKDTVEMLRAIDDVRRLASMSAVHMTIPGSGFVLPIVIKSEWGKKWVVPRTMTGDQLVVWPNSPLTKWNDLLESLKTTNDMIEKAIPVEEITIDDIARMDMSHEEFLNLLDEVIEADAKLNLTEAAL